ncbi:MAG TPA: hypothetical protein VGM88_03190 [Kofleriaceae bacterium]|jgi:hypothetical protein
MLRGLVGVLLCSAAACSNAPSKDQCQALLDHLVDIEVKHGGGGSDAVKADLAKTKEALSGSASDDFMKTCKDKVSKARIECAMAASDMDGLAKCDAQ